MEQDFSDRIKDYQRLYHVEIVQTEAPGLYKYYSTQRPVAVSYTHLVYREQALGLDTGKTPLLQDLYEELLKQPEPEARRVATALELYCTGSLNLFNHPTNVKTDSRVVCICLLYTSSQYLRYFNKKVQPNPPALSQSWERGRLWRIYPRRLPGK